MQPALATSLPAWDTFIKRWLWHRGVKIFLIHYGVWVAVSIAFGWLFMTYLPADLLLKTSPLIAKYRNDWGDYVIVSLVVDFFYVLPVDSSYWVFRASLERGKVWGAVLFVIYYLVYFFFLSFITGVLFGYFNLPMKPAEIASAVIFMWVYTLIFIGVRAYRRNQRQQRELEVQKTHAELQALKAQVNPHFMFNTLNNLYGTALSGDTNRTAAGIEQLSSVMRHITEASQRELIPIADELRFVEDIVELHRMRLPNLENIEISTDIEWDEQPAQIVPLLLNPLIENAFKYGISIQHPCFVCMQLRIKNRQLIMQLTNSVNAGSQLEKGTGTGLKNVRQRLALAYPKAHTLLVKQENDVFLVDLTINLQS